VQEQAVEDCFLSIKKIIFWGDLCELL
jgi:hypothetical protein